MPESPSAEKQSMEKSGSKNKKKSELINEIMIKRPEKAENEKNGTRSNFCIMKIKSVHQQTADIFDNTSTTVKLWIGVWFGNKKTPIEQNKIVIKTA